MKVFLTGGTSGLGWGVLPVLKAAGHEVVSLTSRSEGAAELRRRGVGAVVGDLREPARWISHARDADAIIHMAEIFPMARITRARLRTLADADTAATRALLEVAGTRARAFVYTSGAFVYGPCTVPAQEDQALRPHELVRFKAANDELVLDAGRQGRVPAMTARLGSVYGRGGKFGLSPLSNALRGKRGAVLAPGTQRANYVYAGDVGRAYAAMLAAPRPGEAYNIGGDRADTALHVATSLARLCAVPEKVTVLPGPLARLLLGIAAGPLTTSHVIDSAKVKRHFGLDWEHPTIDTGLPALVAHSRAA